MALRAKAAMVSAQTAGTTTVATVVVIAASAKNAATVTAKTAVFAAPTATHAAVAADVAVTEWVSSSC
jgi:hypothetical protein